MSKASVAEFGRGLGQGFVNAANIYAQHKLKEVEQSRVKDLLNRLEGASDVEKVQIYGELDPKLALGYQIANEKNKVKQEGMQLVQQTLAENGLGGQQVAPQQNTQAVTQQGTPSQPGTSFAPNAPQDAARNATKLNFPGNANFVQQPVMSVENTRVEPNQQQAQQQAPPPQQLTPRQQAQKIRASAAQIATINPPAAQALLQEANAIEKVASDQNKEDRKDAREDRKENREYVNNVVNAFKGTKNQEAILNQMGELAESDHLTTPAMDSLLGKMGIPLGVLNNPDSEEFVKLSNNLTRDITKFYGARINQTEFINFLQQIPTLSNSPEGRKRVIENLKRMLEPNKLEYQTMKEIMAENGGVAPANLNFLVTERMEPKLDEWASEINKNMRASKQKTVKTPLGDDEVSMKFPDGSSRRVPKADVGKWLEWGTIE